MIEKRCSLSIQIAHYEAQLQFLSFFFSLLSLVLLLFHLCAGQTNLAHNGFDANFELMSVRRNSYSGTGLRNDLTYLMGYTANSLYNAKRNSLAQSETSGTLFAHKLSTELKTKEKEVEMVKTEAERLKIVVADMQKENKKLRSQARAEKSNYERMLSQVRHDLIDTLIVMG